jgi:hypothetical protein
VQRDHNRNRHHNQRNVRNRIRDRRGRIKSILINACALERPVPGLCNGSARENQRECNCDRVSDDDARDAVQRESVEALLADDAVVEDDQ